MRTLNELMNEARRSFESTHWEFVDGYYVKTFNDGTVISRHRYIAEKVLGKPLPVGSEVHHVNGNGFDNRHWNLVVCQDYNYHMLLHERTKQIFGEHWTYYKLKEASWDWREGRKAKTEGREPLPYRDHVNQLKAASMLAMLQEQEWWNKQWEGTPLGMWRL
jgi:hypothetical protein